MKVFVTRWFARFARQEEIADASLIEAIERAERGQVDADLGGGLIKQRVARKGKGRSGGYRVIVGYQPRKRAAFVFGFAKSDTENIDARQLATARKIAAKLLQADGHEIALLIDEGELKEI